MEFSLQSSIDLLSHTPETLHALTAGLGSEWVNQNEGGDSWTVFDIVGHLIHGEKTDWIPRAEQMLSDKADKHFVPFDRFAQFSNSKGKSFESLLAEFETLRKANLDKLRSFNLQPKDLQKTGIHPTFGEVTLEQLLATWTVHDLNHLAQITRVMAVQYKQAVGPWTAFLRVLGTI
jgi:hypothetical protein